MPFSGEIAAISGAVIGVVGLVLGLRFAHFEKSIDEQESKIDAWSGEIRKTLENEIKKKKTADIESVINNVNSLSAVDSMKKSLQRICRIMSRGFILDFIAIAFLVAVPIVSVVQTAFDSNGILLMLVTAMIVFVDLYIFASNVREFNSIKANIKARKVV